jgi:hypothetical protein
MVDTVPPERDRLLAQFPELAQYARPAVRLHPRPGEASAHSSSVGGPLLWPAEEPWPVCGREHEIEIERLVEVSDQEAEAGYRQRRRRVEAQHAHRVGHLPEDQLAKLREREERVLAQVPRRAHRRLVRSGGGRFPDPVVLAPVVQVFRRDAPMLPFPDGADLLQILWCPGLHEDMLPLPVIRWRRTVDLAAATACRPELNHVRWDTWRITACEVHPEAVVDYPPICYPDVNGELSSGRCGILPAGTEERLQERERLLGACEEAYYRLASAPGWKLGGWQSPRLDADHLRTCACGAPMDPLLQIDRTELLGNWTPRDEPDFDWGDPEEWRRSGGPSGIILTPDGLYWILLCSADARHDIATSQN